MRYIVLMMTTFGFALGCDSDSHAPAEQGSAQPTITAPVTKSDKKPSKIELTPQKKYAAKLAQDALDRKKVALTVGWTGIGDALPKTLDGLKRLGMPGKAKSKNEVQVAYIGKDRSINVNLTRVPGPQVLLESGTVKKDNTTGEEKKGLTVDGVHIERTYVGGDLKQSTARAVFANKLQVRLAVRPAKSPDESVELLQKLGFKFLQNRADGM